MSLTLIAGLLLAGFFLLIAIAYINNVVENNKLKVARQRAALTDLIRRCAILALSLPEQMVTAKLKKTLVALELYWSEQLLSINKQSSKLRERITRLQEYDPTSEEQDKRPSSNPSIRQVHTEAKFNEIRYLLEDFYNLISCAGKDSQLSASEVKYWHQETRHLSALLYVEYLNNLGETALQRKQFVKARQMFEQAVKYLSKKPNFPDCQTRLELLEQRIAQIAANAPDTTETTESNELAEEIKSSTDMGDGDGWKKKNFYE